MAGRVLLDFGAAVHVFFFNNQVENFFRFFKYVTNIVGSALISSVFVAYVFIIFRV